MIFLVNPAKKKAAKKRKKQKSGASGSRTSKAKGKARQSSTASSKTRRIGGTMAAKKKAAKRKPARKATTKRRRRKTTGRKSPVQRLARGKVYVTNGRRRRRSYRRNAVIRGGILGTVTRVGKDAVGVIAGMAGTNFIARKIPFGDGSLAIETAKKIAVALGLGMAAQKAMGRGVGEKVLLGGMVAVASDLLRQVPTIGTALAGDDDLRYIARTGLSAYPMVGMGAYADTGAMAVADGAMAYRN